MITSMINPMIRPMITTMINGDSLGTFRYFLDFDSTLETYGELAKVITFPTDYIIRWKDDFASPSVTIRILGLPLSSAHRVYLTSADGLRFRVNDVVVSFTDGNYSADNKFHQRQIEKSGNNFIYSEDDNVIETVVSAAAAAETLILQTVGQGNSTGFVDGVMADIDFNGEIYPINPSNPTQDFELPLNNVTGPEEVTNGDFSNGTAGWAGGNGATLSVVDGSLRVQNNGTSAGRGEQVISTVIGSVYKVTASNTDVNPSRVRVGTTDTNGDLVNEFMSGGSSIEEFFTATATSLFVGLFTNSTDNNTTRDFDDITVVEVTNALILNNAPESNRNQFQLVARATPELVTNGDFSNGLTGWSAINGALISLVSGGMLVNRNGSANGTEHAESGLLSNAVIGDTYLISYDVISLSNGVSISFGGFNTPTETTTGSKTATVTATAASAVIRVGARNGLNATVTVDNISIRRTAANDWIGVTQEVINGNFATDTDWTKGTGWTIGSGVASCDGSTNSLLLNTGGQDLIEGFTYLTLFAVTDFTSGTVRINTGGTDGTQRSAIGDYTEILTGGASATVNTRLVSQFTLGFDGSVDNVSVKRILEAP